MFANIVVWIGDSLRLFVDAFRALTHPPMEVLLSLIDLNVPSVVLDTILILSFSLGRAYTALDGFRRTRTELRNYYSLYSENRIMADASRIEEWEDAHPDNDLTDFIEENFSQLALGKRIVSSLKAIPFPFLLRWAQSLVKVGDETRLDVILLGWDAVNLGLPAQRRRRFLADALYFVMSGATIFLLIEALFLIDGLYRNLSL